MESEIKLRVDADVYQALLAFRVTERVEQLNRFFDSEDRVLRRHGMALRLRTEGDRHLLTTKGSRAPAASDGLFIRPETECEISAADALRLTGGFALYECGHQPCLQLIGALGDLRVAEIYRFRNFRAGLRIGSWRPELDMTMIGDQVRYEVELEVAPDRAGEAGQFLDRWFRERGWAFRPSTETKMAQAERWQARCGAG